MKVLTLNNADFNVHCQKLELLTADFNPDLLITIASGGDYVGANIFANVARMSVSCQRPGTKNKKKSRLFRSVVKVLPHPVTNVLRMVEARVLALRKPRLRSISFTEKQKQAIKQAQRILVIDDAVDTGASLIAVLDAVYKIDGSSKVRSAAITVTSERPMAMPDFFIYNDETLIRFPWAPDAD